MQRTNNSSTSPTSVNYSPSPTDLPREFTPVSFKGIKSILKTSQTESPTPTRRKEISYNPISSVTLIPSRKEYYLSEIAKEVWDISHLDLIDPELDVYYTIEEKNARILAREKAKADSFFVKIFFSQIKSHTSLDAPKKDRIYTPNAKPDFPLRLPSENFSLNQKGTNFLTEKAVNWLTEVQQNKKDKQEYLKTLSSKKAREISFMEKNSTVVSKLPDPDSNL